MQCGAGRGRAGHNRAYFKEGAANAVLTGRNPSHCDGAAVCQPAPSFNWAREFRCSASALNTEPGLPVAYAGLTEPDEPSLDKAAEVCKKDAKENGGLFRSIEPPPHPCPAGVDRRA